MNKYLVKRSIVRFNLPYTINLPDDLYVVNLGEVVATISLKRKATRDNRSVLHSISFPNDSYVLGDRWGRFGYTNATIQFDHPISIKYHVMLQDYLLELSVRSINRILDVCRSTKGDHYIRINRSDLFSYNVRFIDINDGLIPGDVLGIINNSIVSMGRAGYPSASQLDRIKKDLKNNLRLPLYQELLFNSYDYHFYGDYKMSVIESGTAFQVFIENFLADAYRSLGEPDKKIEGILKSRFENLLKVHIKKVTKIYFWSSQKYKDWKQYSW